jgi:hypothetical protein
MITHIPINNIQQLVNAINEITGENNVSIEQIEQMVNQSINNQNNDNNDDENYDDNSVEENDDENNENNENNEDEQDFNTYMANNHTLNINFVHPTQEINNKLTYCQNNLKKSFEFNNSTMVFNNCIPKLTYTYNLYGQKQKNRPIHKNWFLQEEIIQTLNSTHNDLSSYIVQMITDNSINMYIVLDAKFNDPRDKTKIQNIGTLVQDWINYMEYIDGAYHLNMNNINDLNTLIVWCFIMCADMKFIPTILQSHICTQNMFSIEFLQRKAGIVSLMMMSVWNKEIRDIIVSNIGNMLYTTLLNEEIVFNDTHKLTLLDMSLYVNTFYDMLYDNYIDIDGIMYNNNDTIYHILLKSVSPFFNEMRTSNNNFKKLSHYELNYDDLSQELRNKFSESIVQKNCNNTLPISYYCMTNKFTENEYKYLINNSKFLTPYFEIQENEYFEIIIKLTLNNSYQIEPLILIDNIIKTNKIGQILEKSEQILDKYYEYYINYAFNLEQFKINELNDNLNTFYSKLCDKKQYIKLFLNDYEDIKDTFNTMIQNIKSDEYEHIIKILINIYIQKNINYFVHIPDYIFDNFCGILMLYYTDCNDIIMYLSNIFEPVLFKTTAFKLVLFKVYFISAYQNYASSIYLTNLDRFYNEINLNEKEEFTKFLIDYATPDNFKIDISTTNHFNIVKTYEKFFDIIAPKLDKKTFMIFNHKFSSMVFKLLSHFQILNEVKFGDINDDTINILNLIETQSTIDDQLNLPEMDKYKHKHSLRIIEVLTNICDDDDFDKCLKIFNINEDYIKTYNIKDIYINKIIDKSANIDNIACFISIFKYVKDDVKDLNFNQLTEINTPEALLMLEHLAFGALLPENILSNIYNKFTLEHIDFNDENDIQNDLRIQFYEKIIQNYGHNENILKISFEKILNRNINYDNIKKLIDSYQLFNAFVMELNITNYQSIAYLMKYYINNNDILSQLVSMYHKTFIDTNDLNINDKLTILININTSLEIRIPKMFINKLKSNINNDFHNETITKFVNLCKLIEHIIEPEFIRKYPQLVHHTNNKKLINEILESSLENYDIFNQIINYQSRSDKVEHKLLDLTKTNDKTLYIECITKFGKNLNKNDKQLILENIQTDYNFVRHILENKNILDIFDCIEKFIKMKNDIGNYIISYHDNLVINEYLNIFTIDELKQNNNIGIPVIFNFYNDEANIKTLIKYHNLDSLKEICDKSGRTIYDKMIMHGIFDGIPDSYLLNEKNIIQFVQKSSTNIIQKLFDKFSSDVFDKVMLYTDTNGNNVPYYIALYHKNLFKTLVKDKKIHRSNLTNNNFNETFIMSLIKYSNNNTTINIDDLIKWITININLDISDYYVDNNSGSILSYCLKYNPNLFKVFNNTYYKNCINIYDYYEIINPDSMTFKSTVKLNLLQLACVIDHKILETLLKVDQKLSNSILKYKVKIDNKYMNLLSLALMNNPESVQVILRLKSCDNAFIKETEDSLENLSSTNCVGFQKIIDIQPASWYYLQQSLKIKNYNLCLDTDSHWYGYNYKRKMTEANIGQVSHYILDKQELPDKNNICDICETYKRKVVFTNCRHKVCIVCAIRTDKCGNCRINVGEKEKVLI